MKKNLKLFNLSKKNLKSIYGGGPGGPIACSCGSHCISCQSCGSCGGNNDNQLAAQLGEINNLLFAWHDGISNQGPS